MGQRLIDLENKISWFIDGPTTCNNHNWDGDTILYSKSGKRVTPYTYLKWASYTDVFRQKLIYRYHDNIDDPIIEATSSCKNCKQEFDPFWDISEN